MFQDRQNYVYQAKKQKIAGYLDYVLNNLSNRLTQAEMELRNDDQVMLSSHRITGNILPGLNKRALRLYNGDVLLHVLDRSLGRPSLCWHHYHPCY